MAYNFSDALANIYTVVLTAICLWSYEILIAVVASVVARGTNAQHNKFFNDLKKLLLTKTVVWPPTAATYRYIFINIQYR